MQLFGVWLQSFRNYSQKIVGFSDTVTILVGQNGVGKTSILEALALASTGASFRATQIEHMILFDHEYGRVQAKVGVKATQRDDTDAELIEVLITNGSVQGKKTAKRVFSLNGTRKLRKNVVGIFKTVLFRPEDLRLVEGSPARRRNFLDTPLSMKNWRYADALKNYEQGLRRRNKLLEHIREGEARREQLAYWDDLLLKNGQYIQDQRRNFIDTIGQTHFTRNFSMHYLSSIISEARLAEYESRSIAAGHTLIGPHKDDFRIDLDGRDVAAFGSRGQQRLAVLWLKLGERAFLSENPALSEDSALPVLLLDDIFSELDAEARTLVFDLMKTGQTVITSADPQSVTACIEAFPEATVIDLE